VVFHVPGGERISVVVFSVLKKSGYASGESLNFSTLIIVSDNLTRECGFDIASLILSTIPHLGFAENLVASPNVNPL